MKQQKNILIVEDDLDIATWIKGKLDITQNIDSVLHATTIHSAMEFLKLHMPQVMILDLSLPDGSGTEILRKISKEKLNVEVYVFSVNTSMRAACVRMGAKGFFDKGHDADELINAVQLNY